ncbi:MAG: hypothetical protein WC782_14940 [Methylococcaceae bacterium]
MQVLSQLIADGDMHATMQQSQQLIWQQPTGAKLRIAMFQLHCILGNWLKALNQLTAILELDTASLLRVQTDEQVFAGEQSPLSLGGLPAWLALLIQALSLDKQAKPGQAGVLRMEAS